jgi:hypothetical protein
MNLCKDCAYYRPDSIIRAPGLTYCAHPKTTTFDPVLGKPRYEFAVGQRAQGGPCGPSGRLFEPETNPTRRLLRGRGAYALGTLYVAFMGTMVYKLSRW